MKTHKSRVTKPLHMIWRNPFKNGSHTKTLFIPLQMSRYAVFASTKVAVGLWDPFKYFIAEFFRFLPHLAKGFISSSAGCSQLWPRKKLTKKGEKLYIHYCTPEDKVIMSFMANLSAIYWSFGDHLKGFDFLGTLHWFNQYLNGRSLCTLDVCWKQKQERRKK